MDLNKTTVKRLLLLITFTLLLHWGLNHPSRAGAILSGFFSILTPFLLGCCIAFIVNVLLRAVEARWPKLWGKHYGPALKKAKRPVCLLFSTVVILGIIFAIFFIVMPSLKESIASFAAQLPSHLDNLRLWWNDLVLFFDQYSIVLPAFTLDLPDISNAVANFVSQYGHAFLNTTIGITTSLFSLTVNLVLAFVFSLYLLAQKETLKHQVKRVLFALLPEQRAIRVLEISSLTNRTFVSFVTGQLTEAVILGVLCFLGMLLFRMPYASVISVLIGATALIPIFGAFIGIGVGAFLILLASPIQALWFVVFVVLLQQLEGNLIYPRVVGKSVGLPGIWVLAAVTIGGGVFGIIGMLLSVPVCSVLYALGRQGVAARLQKKKKTP